MIEFEILVIVPLLKQIQKWKWDKFNITPVNIPMIYWVNRPVIENKINCLKKSHRPLFYFPLNFSFKKSSPPPFYLKNVNTPSSNLKKKLFSKPTFDTFIKTTVLCIYCVYDTTMNTPSHLAQQVFVPFSPGKNIFAPFFSKKIISSPQFFLEKSLLTPIISEKVFGPDTP